MSKQELESTEFSKVVLGAVFFDLGSGYKYQKVDEPTEGGNNRYGQSYNARSHNHKVSTKNFSHDQIVKAHPTKIRD